MHNNDSSVDPTGVPGLDYVLRGGLARGQIYLIEGSSGAGKTTLGLQFLLEGARRGEHVLWCTLSETEAQLRATARSHGWDLTGVTIANLTHSEEGLGAESEYSFFSPADVELTDVAKKIIALTEREKPRRLVFDPFSDVKLLAQDPLRYRRQVLQLREHFARIGTTVLFIQERGLEAPSDPAAQGVVNGIISLYHHAPDYGRPRRRVRVHKLRAVDYREGFHDVLMKTGGLVVFPRLVATEHALPADASPVSSGVAELDRMLGGGVTRGTSVLLTGPAGVGKSTLASQFLAAAASRGECAVGYLFDETERAFMARSDGLGMNLDRHIRDGNLQIKQVDPAEFAPGEFAHRVRGAVEDEGARVVVIDSLNGYLTGMPDERHLTLHMHELLTYLAYRNVLTVLTLNQHGLIGMPAVSNVEVSFLVDTSVLLRYFESGGAVRRAISVVKRRTGRHDTLIREMTITSERIALGPPLVELRGVLTGNPDYIGNGGHLPFAAEEGHG